MGSGRDLKLTDELKESFYQGIRSGLSICESCSNVGICRQTYQVWKTRAKEPGKENKVYRDFIQGVKQSLIQFKMDRLDAIRTDDDWKAQLKLLERAERNLGQFDFLDLEFKFLSAKEVSVLCFLVSKARGEDPSLEDFRCENSAQALQLAENTL